jgi:hypothetical protein
MAAVPVRGSKFLLLRGSRCIIAENWDGEKVSGNALKGILHGNIDIRLADNGGPLSIRRTSLRC